MTLSLLFSSLILIFVLHISGLVFRFFFPEIDRKLQPIFGFVFLTLVVKFVSALTNVSTPVAIIASIVLLVMLSFVTLKAKLKTEIRSSLKQAFYILIPVNLLTFFLQSKHVLFGTLNFDFLYNVQDSVYLTSHSVNSFSTSDYVLPLNWSADSTGRFSASYLLAFVNLILKSPAATGITWIAICFVFSFTNYKLILQKMLPFSNKLTLNTLASIVSATPLNILSFNYVLFGQWSGVVILLTLIYVFFFLFEPQQENNFRFLALVIILSWALFWIYPAILLTISPFLIAIILIASKSSNIAYLRFKLLSASLFLIVITVGLNWSSTYERVKHLALYSSSTAKDSKFIPYVFNQFTSEIGPLQSSGLIQYPFKSDISKLFPLYVVLFLTLLYTSTYLLRFLLKNRSYDGKNTNLHIFSFFYFYCLIVYFLIYKIVASNYLVFKISAWFQPFVIMAVVVTFINTNKSLKLRYSLNSFILIFLFLLTSTTSAYIFQRITGSSNSFSDLSVENKFEIDKILDQATGRSLLINLPSAEENAWLSLLNGNMLNPEIRSLGNNKQVLSAAYSDACSELKSLQNDASIITSTSTKDIFPNLSFTEGYFLSKNLVRIDASHLQSALIPGNGMFYPETWLKNPMGTNVIRWSPGDFTLNLYSDSDRKFRIRFRIVLGPDASQINNMLMNGEKLQLIKLKDFYEASSKVLNVQRGWNCLRFSGEYKNLNKIPFNDPRADFRPLVIALSHFNLERI